MYGHYCQRAAKIWPNSICRIQLPASVSSPFFERRHGSFCAKPTRIRSGWSSQGLAKRIWSGSKPVSESSGPVSGRTQPSRYQFSHLQTLFRSSTDVIDDTVQNQPRSDLVLADCVRFWPNGSGPEPSRCARIIRPASG